MTIPLPWLPDSWKSKPARHLPDYDDLRALKAATDALHALPPLVSAEEISRLRTSLAAVSKGEGLILQAGDCAESFDGFSEECVRSTFRLVLDMADAMSAAADLPVVRMGRMAGQFAKPRSSGTETRNGLTLPAYKGDIVNGAAFSPEARRPDPQRMLKAYDQSAATLSLLRAQAQESQTEFFTAHEALLLPYEQILARAAQDGKTWNALSAHFLWVGDRTRQPGGAHVEFLRGISNPVGIKCGPSLSSEELLTLLDTLNPENEAGRITLIMRLGHEKTEALLPLLVRAVEQEGRSVIWVCDPMHGNTRTLSNGYKTRELRHIQSEIRAFFAVHSAEGTHPAGLQLELTGQDVTECTGGDVSEDRLPERYRTPCDPRLNAAQGLELAQMVAEELRFHFRKSYPLFAAGGLR